MIIEALYNYYQTLLEDEDSGIAEPGFSNARVEFCLELSPNGELLSIIDLRDTWNNKLQARNLIVPEQVKRSGKNPSPNFLCDNCAYVLGVMRNTDEEKYDGKEKVQWRFSAFVELHQKVLQGVEDKGAHALLQFLLNWNPEHAPTNPEINKYLDDLKRGGNLVFKLEGDYGYLHERQAIGEAWLNYQQSRASNLVGQCLVTGEKNARIARLHPAIKNVPGAQSSGASLVSFDKNAFTSYGKKQSFNAPVSEEVAFGYTTALNYLLRREKNRIRLGDTTVVFWAEKSTHGLEEDLLGALFFPPHESSTNKNQKESRLTRDPQTEVLLQDIFKRIKSGSNITAGLRDINQDTNFFILGLAPNASRLAVRFWHAEPCRKFIARIAQHYKDLDISKSFANEPDFIPVNRLLLETAPFKDRDRIAPLLGGALMRSILNGQPYPAAIYHAILSRIRADHEVNYMRASMIKAYLVRKNRYYQKDSEVNFTVALNENNHNPGYLLGRLFALLEKAQYNANPGIKSTIRDSYFGAASTTPRSVFPLLLRLSQHHISKAEYGRFIDKQMEEVLSQVDSFPASLNLEDQGQFVLGYYQQRKALYTKSDNKEDNA